MPDAIRNIIKQQSRPLEPIPTNAEPVLREMSEIRAVLFDVYGTLFVSGVGDIGISKESQNEQVFVDALRAVGIQSVTRKLSGAEWLKNTIRDSHEKSRTNGIEYPEVDILEIWQSIVENLRASGEVECDTVDFGEALFKKLAMEYESRTNPVWPMPGCRESIQTLARRGFPLGLVSNAQFFTPELFPAFLDADLNKLGFQANLCLFSYQFSQAKPGLFLYERARGILARHDIHPGATLYIGNDMLNDVYAASRVGFRTALFAGDRRSLRMRDGDPRLEGITPDLVLTDLLQLLECLPSRAA